MSDGCQNYDRGLGEKRENVLPKETKPPYFSLNYDDGLSTGKQMDDFYLAQKYKGMIPLCTNRHPKSEKACRELYATELAWCPGCINANKLLDILANYEKLKIKVLEYVDGSTPNDITPAAHQHKQLSELKYYATHE